MRWQWSMYLGAWLSGKRKADALVGQVVNRVVPEHHKFARKSCGPGHPEQEVIGSYSNPLIQPLEGQLPSGGNGPGRDRVL